MTSAPDSRVGLLDLDACGEIVASATRPCWCGRVDRVSGVLVEAVGVPAALGELCRIHRGESGSIDAEVIGFRGATTLLMPHGDLTGIAPRQLVTALGRPFHVPVGAQLLGRVFDGFGAPLDGGPSLPNGMEIRRVRNDSPPPFARKSIDLPLTTGVRAIDGLITIGQGQRLGVFAGSGVGKSTLLGQITRGTEADVIVVGLIGERGREVRAFLEDVLDDESRARSVTVVSTSDRPPIERFIAPFTAVTMAEYFRDQGLNVLLLMDSITRFAAAAREIGLAGGEPPTVRGYPPSFFATVPKLVERLGRFENGTITGLFTVLLDGDDPNEPVADTLRGLLDGHIYLSRDLAQRGQFPAIDVLASLSRLMPEVIPPEHNQLAYAAREVLAEWQEGRDLVEIGAYRSGTNARLDRALELLPSLQAFLCQGVEESNTLEETRAVLAHLLQVPEA